MQLIGLLEKACDRRNARLVCKGFAEAGLPSLTYTVDLSVAGDLLEKAQAIAEHPVVGKYITHIICSGTQLHRGDVNYGNFQNQHRRTRPQTELSVPSPVIYEQFISREEKEGRMIHCQREQAIFLLALQRFVNLKLVTFTDVQPSEDIHDLARPESPGIASGGDWWSLPRPISILLWASKHCIHRAPI